MELKKSKKANLEQKKTSFRLIGLVMVCAVVGMAFEHTDYTEMDEEPVVQEESGLTTFIPMPIVDPLEEEEEVPPPPPLKIEVLIIVPDEEEVEDIDFSIIEEIREVDTTTTVVTVTPETIYTNVDVEPTFPGGTGAMNQWIVDNINYPEISAEMREQGKVYVQFVVDKKGNIEKVSIRRGVSDSLDAEAKRVVKKMPNWIPGEKDGKPVSTNFTLPIHFRLG